MQKTHSIGIHNKTDAHNICKGIVILCLITVIGFSHSVLPSKRSKRIPTFPITIIKVIRHRNTLIIFIISISLPIAYTEPILSIIAKVNYIPKTLLFSNAIFFESNGFAL